MAVYASRTFRRTGGVMGAISNQVKILTLKPVKKIEVTFDAFGENVKDVRNFMYFISAPKVRQTNPSCPIKATVVNDRSEPKISVKLMNGEELLIKSGNLTTLEIFILLNKYVTPLAPVEEQETSTEKIGKRVGKKKKFG